MNLLLAGLIAARAAWPPPRPHLVNYCAALLEDIHRDPLADVDQRLLRESIVRARSSADQVAGQIRDQSMNPAIRALRGFIEDANLPPEIDRRAPHDEPVPLRRYDLDNPPLDLPAASVDMVVGRLRGLERSLTAPEFIAGVMITIGTEQIRERLNRVAARAESLEEMNRTATEGKSLGRISARTRRRLPLRLVGGTAGLTAGAIATQFVFGGTPWYVVSGIGAFMVTAATKYDLLMIQTLISERGNPFLIEARLEDSFRKAGYGPFAILPLHFAREVLTTPNGARELQMVGDGFTVELNAAHALLGSQTGAPVDPHELKATRDLGRTRGPRSVVGFFIDHVLVPDPTSGEPVLVDLVRMNVAPHLRLGNSTRRVERAADPKLTPALRPI